MRKHVMELRPGDRVTEDIFNSNGVFVLQRDTILTDESIVKLVQHGIDFIDIENHIDNVSASSSQPLSASLQKLKPKFDGALDIFETLFLESLANGKFSSDYIDETLQPLMNDLMDQKDVVSLLMMFNHQDEYTYNHSLQVGLLSYYIAIWMGYDEKEAYRVGKAGYLHDMGKCMIPPHILNKPSKLTEEEFDFIKKHTHYGYELILNSTGDETAALVARQHHERDDGSGYPYGLSKEEIHPYARIAAVADTYSAMTSQRVYQSRKEQLTVLQEMYKLSFGKLSGEAVQALIRHLVPNFIGKKVLLTTGETGHIVMTNHSDFFRPLVRTDSRFADLAKEPETSIQEVLM
ncbi:HD-GYP domain-containing protein [Paenibacillus pinistramenti]|uniref:HD-GYP domain-containing protein n=1 Tax=Paenibacillus pinistramenti TaxID=1768003 RepID=UPI0011088F4A|nr:HD-GYP domain-containing protein [Paenibacillus pinistramenti]